ncbi:MAG: hypothetical protein EBU07_08610 [Betaproteobacteria bacterium]|jgi:mono/diheme cytochrome c family protein|nr:hypothetical protein [Betaproteobacteria bacterium]NBS46093.1 hypothetical protein [Betaproteobacteria bacterium]
MGMLAIKSGALLPIRARVLLGATAVIWVSSQALAQPHNAPMGPRMRADSAPASGQRLYETHCASCHGIDGHGAGPMKPYLTTAPSDLTTIARRNGGAFPEQLVWEMIDGRSSTDIGPHGSREMPIWGQQFRNDAQRRGDNAPEWATRNRIVALLGYLQRIQQR